MNLEQLLEATDGNNVEEDLIRHEAVAMEAYANIEHMFEIKNAISTEGMCIGIAEYLNEIDPTILNKPSNHFTAKPSNAFRTYAMEGIGANITKWIFKFIDAFCDYAERFWNWLNSLVKIKKEFSGELKRQNTFNEKVKKDIVARETNIKKDIGTDKDSDGRKADMFYKISNDQLPDLKDLRTSLDNSVTKLIWSFSEDNAAHLQLQTYSMYVQACDKSMGRSLTRIDELVRAFEKGNLLDWNLTQVGLVREQVMSNYMEFSRWQQTISCLKIADLDLSVSKGNLGDALANFYTRLFEGIKALDNEPSTMTYIEALKRKTFQRDLEEIEKHTVKTYDVIILKENYAQVAKNIKTIRELKKILSEKGMITDSKTPESVMMSILGGLQRAMLNSGKMRNLYRIYPRALMRFKMAENRYLQAKQKHYASV